jgi:acylphosphatase
MKQEVHMLFKGSVQGVGFRWTARKYALSHNLNGWVKNLPDGKVELIVQGEKSQVIDFINNLEDAMAGYILEKEVNWQEIKHTFSDFEIRF